MKIGRQDNLVFRRDIDVISTDGRKGLGILEELSISWLSPVSQPETVAVGYK
jgi:hypothetical protein